MKSVPLEFKDIDSSKRTGIIKHCVYNSIDRVGDISTKGMFTKSWQENKSIDFLFNHNEDEIPGTAIKTYEDEEGAYTEVKFGNWKLGDDVMAMAEAGVIRGASFGYITEKKQMIEVKGRKVRKLTEVRHKETSLLTKMPAHPEAGLISLNKSMELKALSSDEQAMIKRCLTMDVECLRDMIDCIIPMPVDSDIYIWLLAQLERRSSLIQDMRMQIKYNSSEIQNMKSYMATLEKFSRETKASDRCIKLIDEEIEETKELLSNYDTATTQQATEPGASRNDSFYKQLLLLNAKFN